MSKANRKAKTAQPKRPRRASQRTIIKINLSESLPGLMIEQCKSDSGGHITVYSGSRAQLVAAGVPEAVFPSGRARTAKFQFQTLNVCGTGSQEMLTGSMRSIAAGFELEVDWNNVRPNWHCAHPAIAELARMLLIDVGDWARDGTKKWSDVPDLAYPIDRLIDDERADYKPAPGAARVQVSPEFHKKLCGYARWLHDLVYTYGEVMPCTDKAVKQSPRPTLRLVGGVATVS
jgi:hypothetical protein